VHCQDDHDQLVNDKRQRRGSIQVGGKGPFSFAISTATPSQRTAEISTEKIDRTRFQLRGAVGLVTEASGIATYPRINHAKSQFSAPAGHSLANALQAEKQKLEKWARMKFHVPLHKSRMR
jgi:hypothetical protein